MRLTGIFDDLQVITSGQCAQRSHVHNLTVEVNSYDCFGTRCDPGFNLRDIHQQGIALDINKDGCGTDQNNCLRGCDEGMRNGDHFISRSNVQGA